MGKLDKKRKKLEDRITEMESELRLSLTKKTSTTAEINLPLQQRKIQELKQALSELK